jgi:NAD-dependent DNA ligase
VLKLAIRSTNREAEASAADDPAYWEEVSRLSNESLNAIHGAGEEVAAAIAMLRESRGEPAADDPDCDFPNADTALG